MESTQLCDRTENSVVIGAIAHLTFKGHFHCVVGVFRPFQQHLCQITLTTHTRILLDESTQLRNRTKNSVEREAIALHPFKGRFVCIVGGFRPFTTAFMSNNL